MALTTQAPRNSFATDQGRFVSVSGPMSKWVEKVLGSGYHEYRGDRAWLPAINVYEGPSEYAVVVDLGGVRGEEIQLHTENGMLLLSGQRPTPAPRELGKPGRDVHIHLMEIDHGPFCRSIELPPDADENKIAASYRCGFLWVVIPKKQ